MRYSLLSNGTLVDGDVVARLLERRTRLDSIQISIDGSCAEIHDASRGRGSFDKALRGLRLLKQAGLPVTSRVTINRHNVGDLERIAGSAARRRRARAASAPTMPSRWAPAATPTASGFRPSWSGPPCSPWPVSIGVTRAG